MSSYQETTAELKSKTLKPKFLPSIESGNGSGAADQSELLGGSVSDDANNAPIFSKQKLQLRIPATCKGLDYTHLTVYKNWLVCVLTSPQQTTMLRFFLPRAIPPGEIVLDKYLVGYKISKLFLDPTGHHTLISLVPNKQGLLADLLYIHGNGPKVRRIEKFKDHEITAVAFNPYQGIESSTGAVLLGTSRGLIFETELMQNSDKPSYLKQVYDLGLGRPKYPITGLELLRISNSQKYIVIATTPDCLYTFQETLRPEDKSLQAIFAPYVNGTQVHGTVKEPTELSPNHKSSPNNSVLRFYISPKYPSQLGWLCGTNIRLGKILTDANSDAIEIGDDRVNLAECMDVANEQRWLSAPKTFVLTEHHALLLYSDHITGICLLNNAIVYEEYFQASLGVLLNIVRDNFTGAVYLYTSKTLFTYKITDEHRHIWRIYLDKGQFEVAEAYAERPEQMDEVLLKKADAAFERQEYELAANIYAMKSLKTFEEICVKFLVLDDKRPIILYVKQRLNALDDNPEHMLVLVSWLVDLYLTQINTPGRVGEERAQWQREFDAFMRDARVAACARENRTAVQNLIAQHADAHNLAQFAIANDDYEEVINQQLSAGNYAEALATLRQQKNIELYYKYCPLLMEHLPHETVEELRAQGQKLQIEKLVPTLIIIDGATHIEEVMKYLEYAIYTLHVRHQAVHNFLLRLYAEHRPTKVIAYLECEGLDYDYDINYALSVCTEFDVKVACVFLQCLLGMWTTAVDLALTFDVPLSKKTALKPRDDETRRKLWLRIAQHDIHGTNDVGKALNLLKECDLLRIEDLLPFFSDFEKIDDFKEPICHALKEYNDKMQELQHDMKAANEQAERVRNELQNVRERCVHIGSHEVCNLCETFLLVKPFFFFACGHKFHSDCLEKQIVPLLSSDTSRRLTSLKQQLESMLTQSIAMAKHLPKEQRQRDKLKQEIEEIVAADCFCCGIMINTIDQPFIEDWDQVKVDWE